MKKTWNHAFLDRISVVIYEGLYFDLAQGQMNGAPNSMRLELTRVGLLV